MNNALIILSELIEKIIIIAALFFNFIYCIIYIFSYFVYSGIKNYS